MASAVLFFWPVLFGGQSFWFRDTITYSYPQAVLTANALSAGELPLWEPAVGLGYPLLADPHSAVFYPLTPLMLLVGMPRAYDLFVWVHVPMAGLFLFALLRRWRLSRPAAALGAAVLMFGGVTVCLTSLTIMLRGLAWMPLALLVFDRFISGGGGRWLAATAIVLAIQGTGTDPLYVVFTLGLLALAPLLRPVPGGDSWGRNLAGLCLAAVLGFLLIACQYLPLAELLSVSDRGAGLPGQELDHFRLEPAQLLHTVLPLAYPDGSTPEYLASFRGGRIPFYPDLYWGIGIAAIALAAFGWLVGARPAAAEDEARARAVIAWVLVGLFSLALALGLTGGLFGALRAVLPPLRMIRYPAKYFLFAALTVPVLAALGFEALARGRTASESILRRTLLTAAAVCLAAWLYVGATGTALPRAFLGGGDLTLSGEVESFLSEVAGRWRARLASGAAMALVLAAFGWLGARGALTGGVALGIVTAASLADMAFTTGRGYGVAPDAALAGSPITLGELAQAGRGMAPPRVASAGTGPVAYLGEGRSVYDLSVLQKEMMTHLSAAPHGVALVPSGSAVWLDSARQLAVLLENGSPARRDRLAAAFGATHALYRNGAGASVRPLDDALPRAFLAPRLRAAQPGEQLPSAPALLALPELAICSPRPAAPGSAGPTRQTTACHIRTYSRRLIELELPPNPAGVLVLLDQHYPGWTASVDGVARPILQVAGLFRGVEVGSGDRVVRMSYEPASFRAGLLLSALAWLAVAGLFLAAPFAASSDRRME